MSFEGFGLAQPLVRAVASQGYTHPTPIQTQAIPHVLAGRDLLGCAQTGTGKTAAFALPILHRLTTAGDGRRSTGGRPRVLVLSPTRELAAQIGDSFAVYGRHTSIRQTVIFGGVGQQPQVRALRRGVDVLVATPGRLLDLMNQGHIDLRSVEIFVLDEADRMLDMGFLPDLRRIIGRLPSARQTLFFSATMPPPIEQLAGDILRGPVRIRIAPVQATTELIEQSVCFVHRERKSQLLAKLLREASVTRALVFTRTKRGADRVARHLGRYGIRAEAMHGDKSQSARQRSLASFKSSRPPVLVATDLAARGIDVDGVSHVFNYDLPHEPETYVHRIGRTGRAGAAGVAVSFCDGEERAYLKAIQRLTQRTLAVEEHDPAELPPALAAPTGAPPRGHAGESAQRPPRKRSDRAGATIRHSRGSPATSFYGRSRQKRRRRGSTALRG
jgi:ATP-dependent RNA helicase RhlE